MNGNLWFLIFVIWLVLSVLAAMSWSFFMAGHEDEDIALEVDNYQRIDTAILKGGEQLEQKTTDPHNGKSGSDD